MNVLLILFGKLLSMVSRFLNVGSGSTWPGHVALSINKSFIREITKANKHLKIILIAGTNGKTTTGKLIQTILKKSNYRVFQNESGANLLNGIASSMLLRSSIFCVINYDYAIFEVDEATLPLVLKEITPDYLILLNLFRDQLDRYGEVNTIAKKWGHALKKLTKGTTLILNADDPQVASLGADMKSPRGWNRSYTSAFYFGLNDKTLAQTTPQHAVDSTYCPNCNSKLHYNSIYYSHLGDWECKNCENRRPKNIFSTSLPSSLTGTYNLYNILAAVLVSKKIGVSDEIIKKSIKTFTPAFGRQEILDIDGKRVQIFLSKNPTSFNESLRTINSLGAKSVLFVLNDRIPDGRDVSWIWDVDFEDFIDDFETITISGDRCYDMALRLKYSVQSSILRQSSGQEFKVQSYSVKCKVYEDLEEAIAEGTRLISNGNTLYVLPTYSAMLEVRKILTGKKIL